MSCTLNWYLHILRNKSFSSLNNQHRLKSHMTISGWCQEFEDQFCQTKKHSLSCSLIDYVWCRFVMKIKIEWLMIGQISQKEKCWLLILSNFGTIGLSKYLYFIFLSHAFLLHYDMPSPYFPHNLKSISSIFLFGLYE